MPTKGFSFAHDAARNRTQNSAHHIARKLPQQAEITTQTMDNSRALRMLVGVLYMSLQALPVFLISLWTTSAKLVRTCCSTERNSNRLCPLLKMPRNYLLPHKAAKKETPALPKSQRPCMCKHVCMHTTWARHQIRTSAHSQQSAE